MTAILGLPSLAPGFGGLGDKSLSRSHWRSWYMKTKGWKIGFSIPAHFEEQVLSLDSRNMKCTVAEKRKMKKREQLLSFILFWSWLMELGRNGVSIMT